MHSCYVSMPFGIKHDTDGRMLDFDFLYSTVIQPAVQELDMECRRLEEFSPGSIWQKTLFTAIVTSDLMIADVSMHNANVLYELGVRHALKRGRTIVISAGGRLPSNISYIQALWYEPDNTGRLTGEAVAKFREALQAIIRQSQRTAISDSPLYEFFPDMEVVFPPELENLRRQRRTPTSKAQRTFVQSVVESPDSTIVKLTQSEDLMRSIGETDPIEYVRLLRKYRDLSAWDRLITLANEAPSEVAQSPEVRQLLALALNRRSEPGDQERAISLMEQLLSETGGDSETFGILGRIYKDRYDQAKARGDQAEAAVNLQKAIEHYRAGFAKNPKDYYPGINVVNMLLQRDDQEAKTELAAVLPKVREAVQEMLEIGRASFWEFATAAHLAAVARDWTEAEHAARQAMTQAPSRWMVESTVRDLRAFAELLTDADDRSSLEVIIGILSRRDVGTEVPNA